MSDCGARMKPIGLTYKPNGELMLVHLCLRCGKISPNRIAGDDNCYAVITLLDEPEAISEETAIGLSRRGIRLLTQEDKQNVLSILYGNGH